MALGTLYGRRVRLTISVPSPTPGDFKGTVRDELEINGGEGGGKDGAGGLRVKFSIKKTDGKEPNSAVIVVSNLSPDNRGSLQKKGVKVTLEAGYESVGVARLFRGDARTIDHIRNGASWDTTIKCGDGERGYRYARVSGSFSPGTGAGQVLQYLADQSGLQVGNVPTVIANLQKANQVYQQGYVVSGKWEAEMNRFLRGTGYIWSVQDETLQVLLPSQANDAQIPLFDADSGLVGSPEFGAPEKKGKPALVKFKTLLTPTKPGDRTHIKSARYDGVVRIKKVDHDGDTHAAEWFTTHEGILPAAVVNS